MYTIISGTNRADSHTEKVALHYQRFLKSKGILAPIFSLEKIDVRNRTAAFTKIENDLLIPTQKFIFIIPEYNGSFPGVLKAMIDISEVKKVWWGKKALLTGVSTGRAGNLRGIDQLTGILNHMKVTVHYNKIPLSVIDKLIKDDMITDLSSLNAIDLQLNEFINF